jgi:hypothetical protein
MIKVANLKCPLLMHLTVVASSWLANLNFASPAFCNEVKDTATKVNAEPNDSEPQDGVPTVQICDCPSLRDQPKRLEWKKAIASRLDSQVYRNYEQLCTCLGPRVCRIEFTIDQFGKVSDVNVVAKTNSSMFNNLAFASVKNLTDMTPIPFPPDAAIEKLKLSSDFVCRRSFMRAD